MKDTTKIEKALTILSCAGIAKDYESVIACQICHTNGNDTIGVYYEYTFRRNTGRGAYHETKSMWAARNNKLQQIADDAFIKRHFTVSLNLINDKRFDNDGYNEYSEYEQSISTSITLKLKPSK